MFFVFAFKSQACRSVGARCFHEHTRLFRPPSIQHDMLLVVSGHRRGRGFLERPRGPPRDSLPDKAERAGHQGEDGDDDDDDDFRRLVCVIRRVFIPF